MGSTIQGGKKEKQKVRNANGNGTIYYEEKYKRYRAEIHWLDNKGVMHCKKFTSSKQTEVKNKLDEFRRQLILQTGEISGSDITFKEYAEHWLENTLYNKLKPTSFARIKVTLNNQVYPHLGEIPINKLTRNNIQDMVNSLNKDGLSYSSIKKAYEAVGSCIKDYRIHVSIAFNPCEGVTLPEHSKRVISNISFFTEDQCQLIIKESTRTFKNGKPVYRLGQSIVVLLFTGLRIGELLALTWSDIDFDNRTIDVNKNAVVAPVSTDNKTSYLLINQNSTKTHSGNRIIPMSDPAYNALQEIYKINGDKKYVMSSSNGRQVTPRNINRMFHSILKQTGIATTIDEQCGVHTLRHTFASMLFKNGEEVKTVSELLGHSDTKITENIYIHLIHKQKVKAIQSLNNLLK